MKQTKLRKRRVIRFAITYFAMLILFIVLIIGPLIVGHNLNIGSAFSSGALSGLVQPTGYNRNDTNYSPTGYAAHTATAGADATTTAAARFAMLRWD